MIILTYLKNLKLKGLTILYRILSSINEFSIEPLSLLNYSCDYLFSELQFSSKARILERYTVGYLNRDRILNLNIPTAYKIVTPIAHFFYFSTALGGAEEAESVDAASFA